MSDHEDSLAQAQGGDQTHAPTDDSTRGAKGKHRRIANTTLQAQTDQTTMAISTLAEAVQDIRQDMKSLKRKHESDEVSTAKKVCSNALDSAVPGISTEGDHKQMEEHSDDDLDLFMVENEPEKQDSNTLSELEDFFEPDEGTGEEIGEQIARITDKALRGKKSKQDDEKLKGLKEKHKRPKNVLNIQVPKVEEFVWRELGRETKRVDYALQKGIVDGGQAITPLAKALDLLQSNKDPALVKSHVMDAFKILSLNIKSTNLKRLELIKRELQPKYRDLCPEEPSATKLLGDNFQDSLKKMDGTKGHITMSTRSFLGKTGGDRHQPPYRNNNNFNNNNNNRRYYQHQQQKHPQRASKAGYRNYSKTKGHPHSTRK